jgi:hypothetical protein
MPAMPAPPDPFDVVPVRGAGTHRVAPHRRHRDAGQATTEYALVMLGAAVIALLVVTWATAGGGAGKIGQLFDRVVDAVTGKI